MPGGIGHRDRPTLRHAEQRKPLQPKRFHDRLQIGDPVLEGEFTGVPIGQPTAAFVVANELVFRCEIAHPVAPHRAFDVVPQMGHPVGGADEWGPFAGDRIRQPDAVGRTAERDVLTRRWGLRLGLDRRLGCVDDEGADELVAPATDGADEPLRLTVVAECPAGCLDPTGQRRLTDEATAPDGVEQLLLGDQTLVMGHQLSHHVEHLRLDADHHAVAAQLVAGGVEDELVEDPRAAGRGRLRGRHE